LDEGWRSLGKGGNAPAPVAVDALSTECQPGTYDGTDVPQAVVDGGNTGTMLRMADLGEKQGGRELGKGVAETHEKSSTHEVVEVLSSSLDGGTNKHDETSDDDSGLASKVIGNEGGDRERGNGTDRVKSCQETKSRFFWVAEVVLPVVENAEVVQHGSSGVSACVCVTRGRSHTHHNQWSQTRYR
jgi:hypothetical protein